MEIIKTARFALGGFSSPARITRQFVIANLLVPAVFLMVNCLCVVGWAEDFTQFRGSSAGFAANQTIPLTWSVTENLAWKVTLPGAGWSQPVVWQDRVYVTTAVADPPMRPKNFADGVKMPQSMGLGGFTSAPNVTTAYQLICLDVKQNGVTHRWRRRSN